MKTLNSKFIFTIIIIASAGWFFFTNHLLDPNKNNRQPYDHLKSCLQIYAASSMVDALDQIIKSFNDEHSSICVNAMYGGSSSLARQIANGAPADLFISANTKWTDYLKEQQLIAQTNTLAHNKLVVITNSANYALNSLTLTSFAAWVDILDEDKHLALGDPQSVPAGEYAAQALNNLGLWQNLTPYIIPTKNVRLALSLVENQAAILGIVYLSDAINNSKVKIIASFANTDHDNIVYPVALLNNQHNNTTQKLNDLTHQSAVELFFNYLQSKQTQTILQEHGFLI